MRAVPSTGQGMHPSVALETSTLRRMSLVQYSSCCQVSPQSYRHPRTFRCNRTRCGGGNCRKKKDIFIAAGRDLDTTLSSSCWFWILFASVEQLIKLKFLVQQMELKWRIFNSQSRATLWVRDMSHRAASTFDHHSYNRLIVLRDIQHCTETRTRCIWWNVINVCWNDVGVLDWYGIMHVWPDNCRRVSP